MKKSLLLGAVGALLLVGAGCASTNAPTGDTSINTNPTPTPAPVVDTSPIKIGWIGPLTGDLASLGQDAEKATEVALDEVNAAGGINGRPLQLVPQDSKCNPKDASDAGNKLINVDKVSVILGGLCSGETTAVAPVAEQNHVVMISPCSSAPNITFLGF